MNNELKYIFKGVFYACILFAIIYTAYYIISSEKTKIVKTKPPVITREKLLSLPQIAEGKNLFIKNCEACHKLLAKDGSNFQNIVDNNYNKKDLYGWIRNSDSVIKSGNKYYNAVFNEYNKTRMTSFPNFTDKEIDEIIAYIKVEKTFQ